MQPICSKRAKVAYLVLSAYILYGGPLWAQSSTDVEVYSPAVNRPTPVETTAPTSTTPGILKLDSTSASTPIGIYLGGAHLFASCPNQAGCYTTGNNTPNTNELYTLLVRTKKQFPNRNEWPVIIDGYDNLPGTYLGFNSTVAVASGGGSAWAGNFNTVINTGSAAPAVLQRGVEIDLTNQASDFAGSGKDAYALWIQAGGNHENTAAIQMDSYTHGNQGGYGFQYGLWVGSGYGSGYLARLADILDTSSAQVALDIGHDPNYNTYATHATAVIRDQSYAPFGAMLMGRYSTSALAINDAQVGQQAISLQGSYQFQAVNDASTAPIGTHLAGSYSTAAISVTGTTPIALDMNPNQKICYSQNLFCFSYNNSTNRLEVTGTANGSVIFWLDNGGNYHFAGAQQ